jgi:adenine phosphoribosyltransferase
MHIQDVPNFPKPGVLFKDITSLLADFIRDVPNFPKPGVLFKDITPLLADAEAFESAINQMVNMLPPSTTHIVGLESRGFIFGAAIAAKAALPFVLARKPGKLPGETVSAEFTLEYGTDTLQMHKDAFEGYPDAQVTIVDDVLATGGTLKAAQDLVAKAGATVAGNLVLMELSFLNGRERLIPETYSLIKYED